MPPVISEKIVRGWAQAQKGSSFYCQPKTVDELESVIQIAKAQKLNICPVGSARSYGDEILNENNLIVDCSQMNRVLDWDSSKGILVVEPGVTLEQALRVCLQENWILPVVPGTRFPSFGGCVANNVHGKNSFKEGNFGDWVLSFDLLLASLEVVTCSRHENPELFFSAIGGMGMLGFLVRIEVQLKKVSSPYLIVEKRTVPHLAAMLADFTRYASTADYLVAQLDSFKKGNGLGRGTIHMAKIAHDASFRDPLQGIEISERFRLSKSWLSKIGQRLLSPLTMRIISWVKYYLESLFSSRRGYLQSFCEYQFLLDRIPYWPELYRNGFYEIEPLIPIENAHQAFYEMIRLFHQYRLPAYIAGVKLHQKDDFVLSFSLNGFSIGFDFPVLLHKHNEQMKMFYEIHEIIANYGGIVYFAKDNLLSPKHFKKMYNGRVTQFLALKRKYDPNTLFQSSLFRRLFLS